MWLIGDYAHEMAGVGQAVGYRTGFVQLFQRSALARSHVSREMKQIDSEKPDLIDVNLFVDRSDGAKKIANMHAMAHPASTHERRYKPVRISATQGWVPLATAAKRMQAGMALGDDIPFA